MRIYKVVKDDESELVEDTRPSWAMSTQPADRIVEGVTNEPPGSGRVDDLAEWYRIALEKQDPPSPFGE